MSAAVRYITVQTDHEAVERFVERLATFDLDEWLSVASDASRDASSRAQTLAVLEGLIAEYGLAVDAWSIADDVETAAQYSLGSARPSTSRRDYELLRLARQSATTAALALFLRASLSAADFESLYEPFATLVPLDEPRAPQAPDGQSPARSAPRTAQRWPRGAA